MVPDRSPFAAVTVAIGGAIALRFFFAEILPPEASALSEGTNA